MVCNYELGVTVDYEIYLAEVPDRPLTTGDEDLFRRAVEARNYYHNVEDPPGLGVHAKAWSEDASGVRAYDTWRGAHGVLVEILAERYPFGDQQDVDKWNHNVFEQNARLGRERL